MKRNVPAQLWFNIRLQKATARVKCFPTYWGCWLIYHYANITSHPTVDTQQYKCFSSTWLDGIKLFKTYSLRKIFRKRVVDTKGKATTIPETNWWILTVTKPSHGLIIGETEDDPTQQRISILSINISYCFTFSVIHSDDTVYKEQYSYHSSLSLNVFGPVFVGANGSGCAFCSRHSKRRQCDRNPNEIHQEDWGKSACRWWMKLLWCRGWRSWKEPAYWIWKTLIIMFSQSQTSTVKPKKRVDPLSGI